jgi:Putative Flp pilus-assembly TadE/G-like
MLNDPRYRNQRGQTIPFWVFAAVTSFVLTFFVINYTNTVRWHIRAQNAADAAAIAAIAGDASLMNQRTLTEYAAAYDEYRLRSAIYSIINAANGVGSSATQSTPGAVTSTCDPSIAADDTGIDCDNAYDQEPFFYDQALQQYVLVTQELESLIAPSPPPVVTPAPSATGVATPIPVPIPPKGSMAAAAFSLVQSDQYCWDTNIQASPRQPGIFDCAFWYNANISNTGLNSSEVVDVVACRNVTPQSPLLFSGLLAPQFQAVGRAAATLASISNTFSPGTQTAPGGALFAPPENCPPTNGTPSGSCNVNTGWMSTPSYTVNYSGFAVNATFYVPVLTKPLSTGIPALSCEPG